MKILEIVKVLENLSPRTGKREKKAKKYILDFLEGVEVREQKFRNAVPKGSSKLLINGREIESLPSSFVSGKFEGKPLISSLHVSGRYYFSSNINFNPYSNTISLATFYFAPSIAVHRKNVGKILSAESVEAKVKVKKEKFVSANLIIGNLENPKALCFAHYDTVLNGAIDNSSGTAVLLHLIKIRPEILKKICIVLSGSEELSYDKPIYWGKGYRVFEEEYKSLLEKTKRIAVVDCVGFANPVLTKKLLLEAFPVKMLERIKKKTFLVTGEIEKLETLWKVYHSDLDRVNLLSEKYLKEAENLILKFTGNPPRGEGFS